MTTAVRDAPWVADAIADEVVADAVSVLPDHHSVSQMATFQVCPRQWRYKYLDNVPAEFMPSSLLFGAAVHAALETIHYAVMKQGRVTIDDAIQTFTGYWAAASANNAVRFCKHETAESLHILARSLLALYIEQHIPSLGRVLSIEERVRVELPGMGVPVVGRIDWLAEDDHILCLADAKTARSGFNDDKLREAKPQLALYASVYAPLAASLGKPLRGRFVVFRKLKQARIETVDIGLAAADLDRTCQMLRETRSLIEAAHATNSFPIRLSWACKQCVFQSRCQRECTTTD